MGQIGAVQLTRGRRQAARQIDVTDDRHAAMLDHLSRPSQRAVAAVLGREIDDHRAGTHAVHHVLGDQHRRRLSGDQRGGDDDVDVPGLIGEEGHLSGDELGAHFLGVPALARTVLIELNLEELGAQALDLLFDRRPRIESAHDRSEPARCANGSQTRYAGADHEHLGWRDLAGRRHLAGEETSVKARRFDHRAIAGDVGHRAQRVHLLRPGNARNQVHRQHGRGALGEPLDQLAVFCRPDEADQCRAFTQ